MIADLKPYPEYKESGLPWLGQVPSHWKYRRTKFLFRERVAKGFADEPLLAATQTKGVVKKTDYGERTVTAMKDFHLLKLVETGDFVISLRSFEGGIEIAHCRGIISPAYTVLEPRSEARRNYYRHFFKSPDFIRNLTLFVTGIREGQNIDYERLSRAYLPLPPEVEQEQIGRFLDWANGRLERAIRAKRKVIALLHEQKQAIIHQAVTQGIHPNAPKRDSGIPWLGEIPEHWEVRKLNRVCFFQEGPGLRTWQFTASGIQVICVTNITAQGVDLSAYQRFISRSEYETKYSHFTVVSGDVMLASSGNSWGKIAEFNGSETVILNTSTIRLNPSKIGSISTPFLKLFLTADYVRLQLQSLLTGSCQPNFGPSHLNRLLIAFPSDLGEQAKLVSQAEYIVKPILSAIGRYEREITLLREYRTRLVADVVTGKLDVREVAAGLPEEGEELAPEEEVEADEAGEELEEVEG